MPPYPKPEIGFILALGDNSPRAMSKAAAILFLLCLITLQKGTLIDWGGAVEKGLSSRNQS